MFDLQIFKGLEKPRADTDSSDQTAQVCRLTEAFDFRACHKKGFSLDATHFIIKTFLLKLSSLSLWNQLLNVRESFNTSRRENMFSEHSYMFRKDNIFILGVNPAN